MRKELHEIQWLDCKVESIASEGKGKMQYIISGPFMKADVPNRNKHVYKRDEANKAIAKLRPMVQERRIRMLVDHPDFLSYGASLVRAGALLMDITDVQDDGYAYYKAKILNTTVGKDLKAILDGGSKIGVSTRGMANVKSEEIVGYEGKFDVIYDWELSSIDFVDDPAVLDTEAYMHLESKKRSSVMFKTVEEMKAACPELVQKLVDSTIADVKQEYDVKLQEAEKKVQETAQELSAKATELETVVEGIKKVFPDKFTVIEESKLVEEKAQQLSETEKALQDAKAEADKLRSQIKEIEDAHTKAERDAYVDHLKATDAEFFALESFKNCFENCLTKDEVKTVYEANAAIVAEMKAKVATPAPAKTQQTGESAEPKKTGLTDDQKKDFEARNLQRRRNGLDPWTEAKYLEKFGSK